MPNEDDEDLPQVESGAVSVDAVRRRVEDWLGRLSLFLKQNEAWAFQHGWRAASVGDVRMHEEPMRDFSVPPARQPTLRLDGPDGAYALFKPKGLWVIGANGRIDLYTGKGAYVIVDRAERFQPPEWTIFRSDGNRDGAPYSPDLLQRLS